MTFDPYELAVRLRALLDVTDCASVLLTHSNGTVFQATRDGELTILADQRVAFDPEAGTDLDAPVRRWTRRASKTEGGVV